MNRIIPADTRLCAVDELTDGATKGFELAEDAWRENIFVHRNGEQISAWRNHCPHTGAPLNWNPDDFLDADKQHFICAIHGARFRTEDGLCVQGPCTGAHLKAVTVTINDGTLYLAEDLDLDNPPF